MPALGESITEATVGHWLKQAGDAVAVDEPLVELETDKVTVEVPAPTSGVLSEIVVKAGDTVAVGALLGSIAAGEGKKAPDGKAAELSGTGTPPVLKPGMIASGEEIPRPRVEEAPWPAPNVEPAGSKLLEREPSPREEVTDNGNGEMPPSPAARKLLAESGLLAEALSGSGRRGQILKEDVLTKAKAAPATAAAASKPAKAAAALFERERAPKPPAAARAPVASDDATREERVRMTRLRQTIAKRLKEAQDTAAMLTTFNDVDMSAVMELRRNYRDAFEQKHGVKLGLMGFFVKAAVAALKEIPAVNAEIDGTDIVYKNYYHIGVAVGTERGLVVPVLREADRMSLADIERTIADFGARAREGRLGWRRCKAAPSPSPMAASMARCCQPRFSTRRNRASSACIASRIAPVVRDGAIVARPMMYFALSYDHRLVDGKEAVTFLVRIKEAIEDPKRLVLDL